MLGQNHIALKEKAMDYNSEIKRLTIKVAQLEAENAYLRKLIEISSAGQESNNFSIEYTANITLKDAIEKN